MEVFGRYQLQERIGQGGMGVVYRAFDTVLERVVALKLVQAPTELEAELRERFFREARAAGHLSHTNIVTIYDLGEQDGRPYIAMEYLDGEDLQKRLARPERMSLRRRLDLAIEICHGIEYAHSRGIVHRDLKPANVYLVESGTAKILDFGLARLMTSQLTQSNMLMGTLNYMAPEQVRGERADQRSDIFSMGVVLYELFGGRRAFEGDSVASTLYKILEVTPEPLSQVDPTLHPDLAVIVDRAMAKLRDERYSDMTSLRVDLETFRQQHLAAGPVTPMATPVTPGRAYTTGPPPNAETVVKPSGVAPPIAASMSRSGVGVAAAALVLTAAAVLWVFSRKESPQPSPPTVTNAAPPANPFAAQLSAAQAALDAKQFAAALSAADAVLAQAPQHPDARRVRDAARRGALADALERASRALRDGATSGAIQAAGEALALDPESAEARRILARVQISSSDADAARAHMAEGRSAAEATGAATHAASALDRAVRAQRDGDRLYSARNFTAAASRYYEAGGLYQSAAAAARAAASLPVAALRPGPAPSAPAEAPAVAAPAVAAPPVIPSAPPVDPPAGGAPQSPAAPPVSSPTIANPPPADDTAQPAGAEDRIIDLVGHYKEALESRNLDHVKRLWPSLGGAAETALRQEFAHARQITVGIANRQISVSGNAGRVSFVRTYGILTVEGQRLQSTSQAVMDVHRAGNSWVIDTIRFSPR
jgi:eukaryotic-like serine/threonine-protein kinase